MKFISKMKLLFYSFLLPNAEQLSIYSDCRLLKSQYWNVTHTWSTRGCRGNSGYKKGHRVRHKIGRHGGIQEGDKQCQVVGEQRCNGELMGYRCFKIGVHGCTRKGTGCSRAHSMEGVGRWVTKGITETKVEGRWEPQWVQNEDRG